MDQPVGMLPRNIVRIVNSQRVLEGGGFPVRRPFPIAELNTCDPFLLFDHLGPVHWGPGEAIGAPDHPHRGFETVTYLLQGQLLHQDSQGHTGKLGPGDVQWMTAGSGVVHSEMPTPAFIRTGGVMHGIQLWINLPARDKWMPPHYQDIAAVRIPEATSDLGRVKVRIIAGHALGQSAVIHTRTPITYLHYILQPGGETWQTIPAAHNAFLYVMSGVIIAGDDNTALKEGQCGLLGEGNSIRLRSPVEAEGPADVLLLSGAPLNEPVARYGPFVMNNEREIHQAIQDYRAGRMGRIDA